jgi:TetR/AcrR family transcriptional regulator, tetracycline repressor protein
MERDVTAKSRGRGSLSREKIIREALAMLEERGSGALSMRRLAQRLDVAPNALYGHLRDKADLVDAIVDEVYAGLTLAPSQSGDWAEQLARLSQAIREHLLAHPAVVPFALQQPGPGPHELRLGEAIYAVLRPAGFSDRAVVGTVHALLTYILGFVALEVPRSDISPESSDEAIRRLRAFFRSLPSGEFPHHVELAPHLAHVSTHEQFEFGIRTLLAGLKARRDANDQPDGNLVSDGHRATATQ